MPFYNQVQQYLLPLEPVAQHQPIVGGQIRVQHDAVPVQFAAGEHQFFNRDVKGPLLGARTKQER
jgi:hypothetical protein